MKAIGLDLGGTKIEAQVFDADWGVVDSRRMTTPRTYPELIVALIDLLDWAETIAPNAPIGLAAAGVLRPDSQTLLAANHCASGRPLLRDLARDVVFLNDAVALGLSEAAFGAGRSAASVVALVLGTGIGGAIVRDRILVRGASGIGGEFGHMSASAALVAAYDLPLVQCGCGRTGCIETMISGPGLERLGQHLHGTPTSAVQIGAQPEKFADVLEVWTALVADFLRNLMLTLDPDRFVLAGGLSKLPQITKRILPVLQENQFDGFAVPAVVLAQGGDASGARGAAFAAYQRAGG